MLISLIGIKYFIRIKDFSELFGTLYNRLPSKFLGSSFVISLFSSYVPQPNEILVDVLPFVENHCTSEATVTDGDVSLKVEIGRTTAVQTLFSNF